MTAKEYLAEHPFDCQNCGEQIEAGEALYFHGGKKVCAGCHESIEEGEGNERYDQDGFGEPER